MFSSIVYNISNHNCQSSKRRVNLEFNDAVEHFITIGERVHLEWKWNSTLKSSQYLSLKVHCWPWKQQVDKIFVTQGSSFFHCEEVKCHRTGVCGKIKDDSQVRQQRPSPHIQLPVITWSKYYTWVTWLSTNHPHDNRKKPGDGVESKLDLFVDLIL